MQGRRWWRLLSCSVGARSNIPDGFSSSPGAGLTAFVQLCWDEPRLFGDPEVLISKLLLLLKLPAEVRSVHFWTRWDVLQ